MNQKEYLEKKIKPIITPLLTEIYKEKPNDVIKSICDYLEKRPEYNRKGLSKVEKEELLNLRQKVKDYRQIILQMKKQSGEKDSDYSFEEIIETQFRAQRTMKKRVTSVAGRKGISAESYGQFNKKEQFKPKFVKKDEQVTAKIKSRILQSFLFNGLENADINIVIGAMEEKKFKEGDIVIKQGDNGDCIYIVESGELDCSIKLPHLENEKYIKTYKPGDSFGELALLYNVPRAATIKAKTECSLWSLDRDTFNNIVKESARLKREKYENFLKSVDIFSTMDKYEISQVSEALKRCTFNAGDFIIRQGEVGDVFYIIEEGEATAFLNKEPGKPAIPELNYTKGGYFGELALLRDQPRAANVKAKTEVKLLSLDRNSFKRVLGPIDQILKRNAEKYKKFVAHK